MSFCRDSFGICFDLLPYLSTLPETKGSHAEKGGNTPKKEITIVQPVDCFWGSFSLLGFREFFFFLKCGKDEKVEWDPALGFLDVFFFCELHSERR